MPLLLGDVVSSLLGSKWCIQPGTSAFRIKCSLRGLNHHLTVISSLLQSATTSTKMLPSLPLLRGDMTHLHTCTHKPAVSLGPQTKSWRESFSRKIRGNARTRANPVHPILLAYIFWERHTRVCASRLLHSCILTTVICDSYSLVSSSDASITGRCSIILAGLKMP